MKFMVVRRPCGMFGPDPQVDYGALEEDAWRRHASVRCTGMGAERPRGDVQAAVRAADRDAYLAVIGHRKRRKMTDFAAAKEAEHAARLAADAAANCPGKEAGELLKAGKRLEECAVVLRDRSRHSYGMAADGLYTVQKPAGTGGRMWRPIGTDMSAAARTRAGGRAGLAMREAAKVSRSAVKSVAKAKVVAARASTELRIAETAASGTGRRARMAAAARPDVGTAARAAVVAARSARTALDGAASRTDSARMTAERAAAAAEREADMREQAAKDAPDGQWSEADGNKAAALRTWAVAIRNRAEPLPRRAEKLREQAAAMASLEERWGGWNTRHPQAGSNATVRPMRGTVRSA